MTKYGEEYGIIENTGTYREYKEYKSIEKNTDIQSLEEYNREKNTEKNTRIQRIQEYREYKKIEKNTDIQRLDKNREYNREKNTENTSYRKYKNKGIRREYRITQITRKRRTILQREEYRKEYKNIGNSRM